MSVKSLVKEAAEEFEKSLTFSVNMSLEKYKDEVLANTYEDMTLYDLMASIAIFLVRDAYIGGYEAACIDILENGKR